MKIHPLLLLGLVLSIFYFVPSEADSGITDDAIWIACWQGGQPTTLRNIHYPDPIYVEIRNRSQDDWQICVFDNLCPYTLYQGLLRHNHSISLSACADEWGRGSVTLMNARGDMWFFEDTRDRVITIDK